MKEENNLEKKFISNVKKSEKVIQLVGYNHDEPILGKIALKLGFYILKFTGKYLTFGNEEEVEYRWKGIKEYELPSTIRFNLN